MSRRRSFRRCCLLVPLLVAAAIPSSARDWDGSPRWVTGWASAQQTPDARNQWPADPSAATTLAR